MDYSIKIKARKLNVSKKDVERITWKNMKRYFLFLVEISFDFLLIIEDFAFLGNEVMRKEDVRKMKNLKKIKR